MSIVPNLIRDMSLWKPQKQALEVFDGIVQPVPLGRSVSKTTIVGTLMGVEALMQD